MRQWSINGRFLTQPVTGVQRYAREIVQALDSAVEDEHPLARGLSLELLVPSGAARLPGLRRISMREIGPLSGHLWEQVTLPLRARGRLLSLCNTGPLVMRDQILCVHDGNVFAFPASYSRMFRTIYGILIPRLLNRCRTVTTVSKYSALQLSVIGGIVSKKFQILPNGHEHVLDWDPARCSMIPDSKFNSVGASTVLVLGSPTPHKNVGLLIGLTDQLAAMGLNVAVIGATDPSVFSGTSIQEGSTTQWLGRLSDDCLALLLSRCFCLAFPSFVEGFGLPPLEAMVRGCPVVVSDRASMPEICGEAALYASPDHPEQWMAAFKTLHADADLRATMITRGLARSQAFSWSHSAEGYLREMARLDGVPVEPS